MNLYLLIYIYIAAVSLLAIIITVRDKSAAHKQTWRIKERTLLMVSALGGSAAMLVTMLVIRHKTRRAKFMAGIPLLLLAQVLFLLLVFNQNLEVSRYGIESDKIAGQIKLVLVTDLHSCDYGDSQSRLIKAVEAQQPDAVLLCGDIFDDLLPPDNTIQFVENISAKYPCYYVSGNHEFWSGKADKFKDILISHGVNVLEGTSGILMVRGEKINISGIDDPDTDRYVSRSAPYPEQLKLLGEIADSDVFQILLSHRPERIWELLPLKPDLVLSGHAHGGQWRIPFILENGLFSPDQGFFPQYTNGIHSFGETDFIVSRGLARESTAAPRVFNRPEIVVITITGTDDT